VKYLLQAALKINNVNILLTYFFPG